MTRKLDNILTTKDLTVGYEQKGGSLSLMKDLNLSLMAGQFVCFIGPNGVGKSTLIKTLCGAHKPINGSVLIDDKPLKELTNSELAHKVSVVLTDPVNVGSITVRELISFGRYPYTGWDMKLAKEDVDIIENAIERTELEEIQLRPFAELSDGQRQKVLIARALCQDTPIMLLDEPTAHLDLNNRIEIINLLKMLSNESGKTILMATHELDLALQAADHLWLAGHNGKITEGFPEDMVLNGTIQKGFNLKGFDLRTGVMTKSVSRQSVSVSGSGHAYIWTINALERNGYEIKPNASVKIQISNEPSLKWILNDQETLSSLEGLISRLIQMD